MSEDKAGSDRELQASASIGAEGYRVEIETEGRTLVADEPGEAGGTDEGPTPFGLLYASLASCVLITIRMYASRKEWPLEGVSVRLYPKRKKASPVESIGMVLELRGDELTEGQRDRLLDIAGKCPVHRTLEAQVHIEASLA